MYVEICRWDTFERVPDGDCSAERFEAPEDAIVALGQTEHDDPTEVIIMRENDTFFIRTGIRTSGAKEVKEGDAISFKITGVLGALKPGDKPYTLNVGTVHDGTEGMLTIRNLGSEKPLNPIYN